VADRFRVLHFAADVRSSVHEDGCLGMSEDFIPYEVLDVEFDPATTRSTVHLQPARAEVLRAGLSRLEAVRETVAGQQRFADLFQASA
jgi:hypothetical protein